MFISVTQYILIVTFWLEYLYHIVYSYGIMLQMEWN